MYTGSLQLFIIIKFSSNYTIICSTNFPYVYPLNLNNKTLIMLLNMTAYAYNFIIKKGYVLCNDTDVSTYIIL